MAGKYIEEEAQEFDPILKELSAASRSIAESMELSDNHAMFAIGVRYIAESSHGANDEAVQTFLVAAGFFDLLEEGLYAELSDQLENGQTALFSALRRVVREIEEENGISPDDELDEDEDDKSHLH